MGSALILFFSRSARVPPVEIISTSSALRAFAKSTTPSLLETLIIASLIFNTAPLLFILINFDPEPIHQTFCPQSRDLPARTAIVQFPDRNDFSRRIGQKNLIRVKKFMPGEKIFLRPKPDFQRALKHHFARHAFQNTGQGGREKTAVFYHKKIAVASFSDKSFFTQKKNLKSVRDSFESGHHLAQVS